MMQLSDERWNETVTLYEKADVDATAAYLASDDHPIGSLEEREADAQYARLRGMADELEERLLNSEAPTQAAALYQLKVFALRRWGIDLDDSPTGDEDDATLRRIFAALCRRG